MKRIFIVTLLVLFLASSAGFAFAMDCEPTTYSNVTPSTFDCMKQKLQDNGINVPPGYDGELSDHGISAHFIYDGESKLTIQITKKPSIVTCRTAANEIGKFVKLCQGS